MGVLSVTLVSFNRECLRDRIMSYIQKHRIFHNQNSTFGGKLGVMGTGLSLLLLSFQTIFVFYTTE